MTLSVSVTVPLPAILGSQVTAGFLELCMEGAHGLNNQLCNLQKELNWIESILFHEVLHKTLSNLSQYFSQTKFH